MPRKYSPTFVLPALGLAALLATAGCTPNDPAAASTGKDGGPSTVTVTSTADKCTLSATSAPSGNVVFQVSNTGDDVTEFYLLAADGKRIVGEIENIGPGLERRLVVTAKPGTYRAACKPGMVGDGIQTAFTVTDSGADTSPTGSEADQLATATASYVGYVRDQTDQLVTATQQFVAAYEAGDDAQARALYPSARVHYERIEPVAESFGDLDPRLDARQADVELGQTWSGWHLLEKDLWAPQPAANGGTAYTALTPAQRTQFGDQLVADTQDLHTRVHAEDFATSLDAATIANGSKGLLDEVATRKVSGEEEIWSHTDLSDFQANVEGAQVAFEDLQDVVHAKDPQLEQQLVTRFKDLTALLAAHQHGSGWVSYTTLTQDQVKALSAAVDALSEPLSRLASAVVL